MQVDQIKVFADQIEVVSKKCKKIIITGDANLCTLKWNEENDLKKNFAFHLKMQLNNVVYIIN